MLRGATVVFYDTKIASLYPDMLHAREHLCDLASQNGRGQRDNES
jgi:hypothetical protein